MPNNINMVTQMIIWLIWKRWCINTMLYSRFTSTSPPYQTTRFRMLTLWGRNIVSSSSSNNCRPTIMKSGRSQSVVMVVIVLPISRGRHQTHSHYITILTSIQHTDKPYMAFWKQIIFQNQFSIFHYLKWYIAYLRIEMFFFLSLKTTETEPLKATCPLLIEWKQTRNTVRLFSLLHSFNFPL